MVHSPIALRELGLVVLLVSPLSFPFFGYVYSSEHIDIYVACIHVSFPRVLLGCV